MKALEKDRARRYETATVLPFDVQRFLANEAVARARQARFTNFASLCDATSFCSSAWV